MYRVYIDVIFAVNLFMDLAVLAMLNRLFSYRADLKHMIRGAVLGAVWDPKQERTDPGSRRDLSNIRSLRRCYAGAF